VSEARRLKVPEEENRNLEGENRKLKKLLADAILDNAALKDIASGNVWSAPSTQQHWKG
jgi:putative transposase